METTGLVLAMEFINLSYDTLFVIFFWWVSDRLLGMFAQSK